ncbi:MAG: EVE domain-containing protein [Phycisphaerales bacterium]
MPTYLLKTEPDDYSWDDLVRDGRTHWDGVTNPTACMVMRDMRTGDEAFIYHTGKEKRIAGLAKVVSDPYPDPARADLTAKGDIKYPLVDVRKLRPAKRTVTLADIKADNRFKDFQLVTQSRLSAMLVPTKLDAILRTLCGL